VTCDATPIRFRAWPIDYCFTDSSYGSEYGSSYISNSDKTSLMGITRKIPLIDKTLSTERVESVGSFTTYNDWGCYTPDKKDDVYYYYYYGNETSMTSALSNQQFSRSLASRSLTEVLNVCPYYTAANTSDGTQNTESCLFQPSSYYQTTQFFIGTLFLIYITF